MMQKIASRALLTGVAAFAAVLAMGAPAHADTSDKQTWYNKYGGSSDQEYANGAAVWLDDGDDFRIDDRAGDSHGVAFWTANTGWKYNNKGWTGSIIVNPGDLANGKSWSAKICLSENSSPISDTCQSFSVTE